MSRGAVLTGAPQLALSGHGQGAAEYEWNALAGYYRDFFLTARELAVVVSVGGPARLLVARWCRRAGQYSEPAAFGKIPVFGPSMENFSEIASDLLLRTRLSRWKVRRCGVAWIELLAQPERRNKMGRMPSNLVD